MFICRPISMHYMLPGGKDYIEAANYMIPNKFLYGSAYPCVDVEGSVAYYLEHLRPEVVEDVMYRNAARFLGWKNKNL